MIENATGIILRTRPLTESSLIVEWIGPSTGRLSTVAKGARKPKSPFAGRLDLFFEADFSFHRGRPGSLHPLREARVVHAPSTFRLDLGRLQQAAYATTCLEQVTEKETPLPELYLLTREFLHTVETMPVQSSTVFAFELKLLRELGLAPDLSGLRLPPHAMDLMQNLLEFPWPELQNLNSNAASLAVLGQWLHGYLIYHLERLPRGRSNAIGACPLPIHEPAPAQ